MSQCSNFIDGNDNFREQNLRFVRNEIEDNFNQFFGGAGGAGSEATGNGPPPRDSIIVKPKPGICLKSFKLNSNEKFFINVGKAQEVPGPPDVTEEQLLEVLDSSTPSSFRVPMSISEVRNTKDRYDNTVEVCDIAINPKFLVKIKASQLFYNFFLRIVAEALSEKYNIQITMDKTIILRNRKFIGTLVTHRVRNDDVKQAADLGAAGEGKSIEASLQADQYNSGSKPATLVQEIDADSAASIRNTWAKSREPIFKLRARVCDENVDEIKAELYLPNCVSSHEFSLDIGEDRIFLESLKHGYVFDKFLRYRLNQARAQALFDKTSKMLLVRIPVLST